MMQSNSIINSALITGGARSGKSAFAERIALGQSKNPVYIATCEIFDDEMKERVALHRERRGAEWQNIHAPLDLVRALNETDHGQTRLVDCVTYWVNNLIYYETDWQLALSELEVAISTQNSPVVFVTNELGMGIVPETKLGREFRDIAGNVNQSIANAVEDLYFVVSGRAMRIK